jgi:hypothetical protein
VRLVVDDIAFRKMAYGDVRSEAKQVLASFAKIPAPRIAMPTILNLFLACGGCDGGCASESCAGMTSPSAQGIAGWRYRGSTFGSMSDKACLIIAPASQARRLHEAIATSPLSTGCVDLSGGPEWLAIALPTRRSDRGYPSAARTGFETPCGGRQGCSTACRHAMWQRAF